MKAPCGALVPGGGSARRGVCFLYMLKRAADTAPLGAEARACVMPLVAPYTLDRLLLSDNWVCVYYCPEDP
jgi:hypothetical protein